MSDQELFAAMKSQMGIDPTKCDKATISLFKEKFFGDSSQKPEQKKKSKTKMKKRQQAMNKNDGGEDDETALNLHQTEADIHRPNDKLKAKRTSTLGKNQEGIIQK
jgi:hypothetical protein